MKFLRPLLGLVLVAASIAVLFVVAKGTHDRRFETQFGELLHETTSEYSRIRVRERDGVRSLLFVDEKGAEQRQSAIDLEAPHELQLGYTRALFASLLFRHPQERVLVVGLGGGGMVRFLQEALPETRTDVVEIDPTVVKLAADFFGTTEGPNTTIHTGDAFVFLREPHGPYDAIYMDAFLKAETESEPEEITPRLKTEAFLNDLQERLQPDGVVAFNLIEQDPSTPKDLEALRSAFPSVYVFSVPGTGNLVAIATLDETRLTSSELHARATKLEQELETGLPFRQFVGNLRD
ncbi:MAG: fused MFS/spermidine synthase [Verrucomicrobiales bacterium]